LLISLFLSLVVLQFHHQFTQWYLLQSAWKYCRGIWPRFCVHRLIYEQDLQWLQLREVRSLLYAWFSKSAEECVPWDTNYGQWDRFWVSCMLRILLPWGIYQ
jgi:hypothetical protein